MSWIKYSSLTRERRDFPNSPGNSCSSGRFTGNETRVFQLCITYCLLYMKWCRSRSATWELLLCSLLTFHFLQQISHVRRCPFCQDAANRTRPHSPPSSMIIRDLTLRSAASFGSFHLIRLLYDEYMFYLVEHKVAKAVGASPVAVMGEVQHAASYIKAIWFPMCHSGH